MKKGSILFMVLSVSIILVSGCKSREEKALETIKTEMYKTINDFDSYQPIETKFDSLENNIFGDTINVDRIKKIDRLVTVIDMAEAKYKKAEEIYNKYSQPRYANSYTDYFRNEAKEAASIMEDCMATAETNGEPLKEEVHKFFNGNLKLVGDFYGWRVTHKFRCKTGDGKSGIYTFTYLMDKDCEKIYRYFDEDYDWESHVSRITQLLSIRDEE